MVSSCFFVGVGADFFDLLTSPRISSPDTRIMDLSEGGYLDLHHISDYDDYYDETSNQELLVPASNKIEASEGK